MVFFPGKTPENRTPYKIFTEAGASGMHSEGRP